MYFAIYEPSGDFQPQILAASATLEDINKVIVSKIGQPVEQLVIYKRCNDYVIHDPMDNYPWELEEDYYKKNNVDQKDNVKKDVPYSMQLIKQEHIISYILTKKQVDKLEEKYRYINKKRSPTHRYKICIFKSKEPCINLMDITHLINDTYGTMGQGRCSCDHDF
jgi:hypothetical protein